MSSEKSVQQYVIRSYECDRNNNLRILTLLNIFQDMADNDAMKHGFGLEFCIKNGMTWVGSNYELEINRLPKMHEKITIKTWPSGKDKFFAYRDFEVFGEDESLIIRATSQWLLISLERKRPLSVQEHLAFHHPLDQHAIETDFPKIDEVKEADETYKFRVRFDDIDLNKHINNAVYILWATEAVEPDFRLNHNPAKIRINFRKEGYMSEKIVVMTKTKDKQSVHSIQTYDSESDRELARVVIDWKPAN
ncbi:MAG: thioesterase [Alphaproteobacteria bacterium]|nr:thioesterase [Alphaproteobacteria bacterium]